MSAVTPDYDIAVLRARIPALATMIPMCNCSQSPLTTDTRAAAERYLDSIRTRGMDWDAWTSEVNNARSAFAALINASPDDVAVFSSVSEAASAVASAIDFTGARRGVVTTEAEFPTIGHVWLAQESRGAAVKWIPVRDGAIDPQEYERAIDDSTAIVSTTHAYYLNGALQDVDAIARVAHAHGALTFIDAYQSAGAVPIDVRASGVDFLASGNLKYLMGIPGIAFLYVNPGRVERLHPQLTGWFGRANPFAFDPKALDWAPGARRFDTGTPPMINAYVARAGMDLIAGVGVDKIRAWHEVLSRRLIEGGHARGLTQHGPQEQDSQRTSASSAAPRCGPKTANTAFTVKDSHKVEEAMRTRGVMASARGPVIRLAPHFYNTLADVDTALDVLADVLRT